MYVRTYVCTYVCMYVCMYVCIYVYVYVCMQTLLYAVLVSTCLLLWFVISKQPSSADCPNIVIVPNCVKMSLKIKYS